MKNVLILHGFNGNSKKNWFPWLGEQLRKKGYQVYIPDLSDAAKPNIKTWTEFIFKNWQPNNESVVIGHSAGAVEVLGVLQGLPEGLVIEKAIMVAGFLDNLGREELNGLFLEVFNFEKIKKISRNIILIHSDNDPAVPIENGYLLKEKLGAQLKIFKGQGHFNLEVGEKYRELPELLELID